MKRNEREKKRLLIKNIALYKDGLQKFQTEYIELKQENKKIQEEKEKIEKDYLLVPNIIRKIFKKIGDKKDV